MIRALENFSGRLLAGLERVSRPRVVQALSLSVGLAWLLMIAIVKVQLLHAGVLTSDIAYYQNMVYNTGYFFSRGSFDFLYSWYDLLSHNSPTYLTEHFSPTLAILAPLYRLIPHPLLLTVMQAITGALAGWGLYRLTRRIMAEKKAPASLALVPLFFQAAYLFNLSNISAYIDSIYGFHQDGMIAALLIWSLVFAVERRWKTALFLFILFLGVKENLPIITAPCMGLCLLFNRIVPRKQAAIGLALCIAFFICCYFFEFRTQNRHVSIVSRFFDIDYVMEAIGRHAKWTTLYPFWPALLTPFFAVSALADFCLQLVGDTTQLDWHSYPLLMYTQIAFAYTCVVGFVLTQRWRTVTLLGLVMLVTLVTVPLITDGVKAYRKIHEGAFRLTPLLQVEDMKDVGRDVPQEAKLVASSDLQIWFSARRRLLWPESMGYGEYIILNRRTPEENAMRRDDFNRTFPTDNTAGAHFYGDVTQVVQGFGYDTSLIAFVDRQLAANLATLVKKQGKVELYRMHQPVPFSYKR